MHFIKTISSPDSTDADLVAAYQKGHQLEILATLYQRYMDLVYGVCLKYLSDEEPAKDAVMNIFEELIGKLKSHQVENFRGWLHVLAKNHCLMQLRSAKNIKTSSLSDSVVQFEENMHLNGVMEKELQLELMTACIRTLPHEQQQCIELFYLESKSYNEIAQITGFDWNAVRSYIQNGRRNLKNCMESNRDADNRTKILNTELKSE